MEEKRSVKNEKENEQDYKEEEEKPSWCFGTESVSKAEINFLLKAAREMESPLIFNILS
jgi:hypothetical protein